MASDSDKKTAILVAAITIFAFLLGSGEASEPELSDFGICIEGKTALNELERKAAGKTPEQWFDRTPNFEECFD